MSDKVWQIVGIGLLAGLFFWALSRQQTGTATPTGLRLVSQEPVGLRLVKPVMYSNEERMYSNEERWQIVYNKQGLPEEVVIHREAKRRNG